MDVAALIPAYDEAGSIAETVTVVAAIPGVAEVVVVDDGSRDETGARARAAGARVLTGRRNRGKAAALRAGFDATDAPVLLLIDGDLGGTAATAGVLVRAVLAGELDLAIGAPPPGGPSGFGQVERLSRAGIRRLTGLRMHRPLSGQRCITRAALEAVRWPRGFGIDVAMTIDVYRAGFRVAEVPMTFEHRRTGRDVAGFRHRARQGVHVAAVLAARAIRG